MSKHQIDMVFSALSDPTRREVIECISEENGVSASQLAARLPVTRQAVAKHLSALSEAGLVSGERHGRQKLYRLTPGPMGDVMGWMARVGAEWDDRLQALERHLASGEDRG
ncbi:MAG: metalloregulator ArsR/SmtB family transcription factor [Actinomycetota bacterium]|jgi:DNA-binding transcriptional ArsR family regulator|nr:metalloregulator ArsR/SmtB family transcription factor [Actinomycetota bacterium]